MPEGLLAWPVLASSELLHWLVAVLSTKVVVKAQIAESSFTNQQVCL